MNTCLFSHEHPKFQNGKACVCGHRNDTGKPPNWKRNFSVGEKFHINGVAFSNLGDKPARPCA